MIILMLKDKQNTRDGMRDLLQEISEHDRGDWIYTMARITEVGKFTVEGNVAVVEYGNEASYLRNLYTPIVDRSGHMIIECMGSEYYYVTSDDYEDEYCYIDDVLHIMEEDFDLVTEYGKIELEV